VSNVAEVNSRGSGLTGLQGCLLLFLRLAVGWHFLYEGYVKIASSGWTAAGYLSIVPGPFAGMFSALVKNPAMIGFVDASMKYGLTAVGLLLVLGLFTRLASVGAAIFLALFYLSNPPWLGVHFMAGEGSYLIVNKNLVELAAALVLAAFPSGHVLGLDMLFCRE